MKVSGAISRPSSVVNRKRHPTQALIDDLRFAIMLADAAAESIRCTDAKQAVA